MDSCSVVTFGNTFGAKDILTKRCKAANHLFARRVSKYRGVSVRSYDDSIFNDTQSDEAPDVVIVDISIFDDDSPSGTKIRNKLMTVLRKDLTKKVNILPITNGVVTPEIVDEFNNKLRVFKDVFSLTNIDLDSPITPAPIAEKTDLEAFIDTSVTLSIKKAFIPNDDPKKEASDMFNKNMRRKLIKKYAKAIEEKSKFTLEHSERVRDYSMAIASKMIGLFDEEELEVLKEVSFLHDCGKLYVPAELLNDGKILDELGREQIDTHSTSALQFIKDFYDEEQLKGITEHHYSKDPNNKYAWVIKVADCLDAMTATRPYNTPKTLAEAMIDLYYNSHNNPRPMFKPEVADVAIEVLVTQLASLGYDAAKMIETYSTEYNYNSLGAERITDEFRKSPFGKNKLNGLKKTYRELPQMIKNMNIPVSPNHDEEKYCELGFRLDRYGRVQSKDYPFEIGSDSVEYKETRIQKRYEAMLLRQISKENTKIKGVSRTKDLGRFNNSQIVFGLKSISEIHKEPHEKTDISKNKKIELSNNARADINAQDRIGANAINNALSNTRENNELAIQKTNYFSLRRIKDAIARFFNHDRD